MRARNIKPAFFANEQLAELEPYTRLLFVGLWCIADKAGRLEHRPKRIKALVFPYETVDVEPMLDSLARCGFIQFYAVDGVNFINIPTFLKHQRPHPHEAASVIPEYNQCHDISLQCNDKVLQCKPDIIIPDTRNEDIRNDDEVTPTESCSEPTPSASAPEPPSPVVTSFKLIKKHGEYQVTQAMIDRWQETFPAVDVFSTLKYIRQWCEDNPAKRKTRNGAARFVSLWLGREQNRGGGMYHQGPQPQQPTLQVKDWPVLT